MHLGGGYGGHTPRDPCRFCDARHYTGAKFIGSRCGSDGGPRVSRLFPRLRSDCSSKSGSAQWKYESLLCSHVVSLCLQNGRTQWPYFRGSDYLFRSCAAAKTVRITLNIINILLPISRRMARQILGFHVPNQGRASGMPQQ